MLQKAITTPFHGLGVTMHCILPKNNKPLHQAVGSPMSPSYMGLLLSINVWRRQSDNGRRDAKTAARGDQLFWHDNGRKIPHFMRKRYRQITASKSRKEYTKIPFEGWQVLFLKKKYVQEKISVWRGGRNSTPRNMLWARNSFFEIKQLLDTTFEWYCEELSRSRRGEILHNSYTQFNSIQFNSYTQPRLLVVSLFIQNISSSSHPYRFC